MLKGNSFFVGKWSLLVILGAFLILNSCGSDSTSFEGLEEDDQALLADSKRANKTYRTGQFYIHYPKGSYTAQNLDGFEEEMSNAKLKVLNIVGVPAYEDELHIIVFESREALQAHRSVPGQFSVSPNTPVYYVVHNENERPYMTHGLFYKVASKHWGWPKGSEMLALGGAVYADARCQGYSFPIDEVGTYLAHKNNLMSYRSMFNRFTPAYREAPQLAEIQAAGLFQFVYDNFGRDKTILLWKTGVWRMEGVFGLSTGEVEKEIKGRWLKMVPNENLDWQKIKQYGC